jgi:hypothetical protein
MKLTIEIAQLSEIEVLLQLFKSLNLEQIQVVLPQPILTPATQKTTDLLKKLQRPIQKKIDLEAIKKAKNYKGVNRTRFNELVRAMNITEPIDLLISQLSQ